MKNATWIGTLSVAALLSSCLLNSPYTVGGTVTGLKGSGLVLQNSSGKYLSVTAAGSFRFTSGLANNATYSVTVRTQPSNPTQTCTVVNGAGTIAKADVTNVLVNCTQTGRFAYVADQNTNSISAYAINATTGALIPLVGSPFPSSGAAPVSATIDPNGTFLYVANSGSNDVSVYAINDLTGQLTDTNLPILVGVNPIDVAIDPTDHYLYVANVGSNSISVFVISPGSSAVTPLSGSPFTIGRQPSALKTDPNGHFLYISNFQDGSVAVLAIDSITGALTTVPGSPFGAGLGARSIAINPAGSFAYVANETAASISAYSITASTGVLTAAPGSPLLTNSSPESVVVDPAGKFLYAANVTSNNDISSYLISPTDGSLTLMSTSGAGALPVSIAVDPSGHFLYAANNRSGDVSAFSIDANGALVAVPGSAFASGAGAGSGPRSIAID